MKDPAEQLAQLLSTSRHTMAFTGAGISTASGIPDFRGPQGIWKNWQPVYYQDFVSSHEARVEHWEFKLSGWLSFRDARPNPAHTALADLEKAGKLEIVVTQNIDGLHQLAGHEEGRVIELHGTNRLIECITCGDLSDPEPVFQEFETTRQPPLCARCGGFLKPATVSFGQQMPADKLRRAEMLASRMQLVMAIGSTLEVHPAASVPLVAKAQGATYVVLNQGVTAHDRIADLRIEGDAAVVLPEVVKHLGKLMS